MVDAARLKELRLQLLRLLTARALTAHEARRRLAAKGASDEEIEAVMSEFAGKRLFDEGGIVEDEIRRAKESRLVGRREVRSKLRARGISEEDTEQGINVGYSATDEFEAAMKFARRKLRILEKLPQEVKIRRLGAALDRRGFPSDIIHKVIGTIDSGNTEYE